MKLKNTVGYIVVHRLPCYVGIHDDVYISSRTAIAPKQGPFDPRTTHQSFNKFVCCQCGREKEKLCESAY